MKINFFIILFYYYMNLAKLNDQVIYKLQNINELYQIYNKINRYYHFIYKTDELLKNFGNFELSILDKDCHHTILENVISHISQNSKNLILTSKYNKCQHVIAYHCIPENYKFEIINSQLDGNMLVIYQNKITNNKYNNV